MKKYTTALLACFLFIFSTTHASTMICPTSAKCKTDQFYSCDVDSDKFVVSPYGHEHVSAGVYKFDHATVFKQNSQYGTGTCNYTMGNSSISFDMIGKPPIIVDTFSSNWDDDVFHGMHIWDCKISPEICFFTLAN